MIRHSLGTSPQRRAPIRCRLLPAALAAALAAPLASGCGLVAELAIAGSALATSGGGSSAAPPIALVQPVPGGRAYFATNVTVTYQIQSAAGTPADLAVDFAVDPDPNRPESELHFEPAVLVSASAGTVVPPNRIAGVPAPSGGAIQSFVWDAVASELPAEATPGVRVRVSTAGGSSTTPAFTVGDDAPVFGSIETTGATGNVRIEFGLADSSRDLAELTLLFAPTPGADFAEARTIGQTSGLETGSVTSPVEHVIVWDTAAESDPIIAHYRSDGARLVLIAADKGARSSVTLTGLTVDNNELPLVAFQPGTTRSPDGADVAVSARLYDFDSTGGSSLRLTLPSGVPLTHFAVVSGGSAGSAPGTVVGIAGSPEGAEVEIVWNAAAQAGPFAASLTLALDATPFDAAFDEAGLRRDFLEGGRGPTATSAPIILGNDAPEVVTVFANLTGGTGSGMIPLVVRIADPNGDSVSVTLTAVIPDVGEVVLDPALDLNGAQTSDLPAPIAGRSYVVNWDTSKPWAVGTRDKSGVTVRVAAEDACGGTAAAVESGPFRVNNNQLPIAIASPVQRAVDLAAVTFTVRVIDPNDEPVAVTVRRSVNGGAFALVQGALSAPQGNPSGATVTGLPASPTGTSYEFSWDARSDPALSGVGTADSASVRLDYLIRDGAAWGVSDTTPAFTLGNNPPSLGSVTIAGDSGAVVVHYTISDGNGDTCLVAPEYSTGGGTFFPIAPTHVAGGLTANLATTPGLTSAYDFTWDTVAEFGHVDETVLVRLTPHDGYAWGAPATTAAQTPITNFVPPSAQILSIGTASSLAAVDGRIPVRFALFNQNADDEPEGPSGRLHVKVEVSGDGGMSYVTATGVVLRDQGRDMGLRTLGGLRARPSPIVQEPEIGVDPGEVNVHTFLWDALADGFGGLGELLALVRVTPISPLSTPVSGQPQVYAIQLAEANPAFGPELARPQAPGLSPRNVVLADLNSDGALDLVAGGYLQVRAGVGYGDGAFAPTYWGSLGGTWLSDLAVADLNRDGKLDVVALLTAADKIDLFFGEGDGTFTGPTVLSFGAQTQPDAMSIGDIDNDDYPDLLVVSPTARQVLTFLNNDHSGTFGDPPLVLDVQSMSNIYDTTLADVDGDGDLDLLISGYDTGGKVSVYLGDGSGGFAWRSEITPEVPANLYQIRAGVLEEILTADVNEDGRPDIVALDGNHAGTWVLLGAGDGTFSVVEVVPSDTAGPDPRGIAAGDLNGDGVLDLAIANSRSNEVIVRLGTGRGTFGPLVAFGVGTWPESVALGDLDGDGRLDLVTANFISQDLSVRLGEGRGGLGLAESAPFAIQFPARDVATGDLDLDGVTDVVLKNYNGSIFQARRGAGGGALHPSQGLGVPGIDVALGDFDNDGYLDAATATTAWYPDPYRNRVLVLAGEGDGTFAWLAAVTVGAHPMRVEVGDLNGDGDLDLVAANYDGDSVSAAIGDGTGWAVTVNAFAVGDGPQALALGDIDNDGSLDVVSANDGSDDASILLGLGAGAFAPAIRLACGDRANPAAVALGDLDGDGRLDLLVLESGHDVVSAWRGLGGGAFAPARTLPVEEDPSGVAIGDVNGDGMLDIAVINETARSVSLFQSLASASARLPRGSPIGRGDGRGGPLRFAHRIISLNTAPQALDLGDFNDDGVVDIALSGAEPEVVQVLVSGAIRPSRTVSPPPPLAGGGEVRRVVVAPLDLGMTDPPLESDVRFAQASFAYAFSPEPGTLTAATEITLPLHSTLTQSELTGKTFRVFRHGQTLIDRTNPRSQIDRRFGRPFHGQVVEVARNVDPPADLETATVDPVAGTISFPVWNLGRYQAFIEMATGTATLFRETFDAAGQDSMGIASLPAGWYGTPDWQVGTPTADRPGPRSAPNLLAIGLRSDLSIPAGDSRAVTSTAFPVWKLNGATATLHFWHCHDLQDGASGTVTLAFRSGGNTNRQLVVPSGGSWTTAPELTESTDIDVTSAINDALGASGLNVESAEARLEFRVEASGGVATKHGWFIDDIDLIIKQ